MQMQVGMKRHTILLLIFLCFLTNALFAQKGEIYVVSVGVSNYQHISDLTLPEKDAKAIAELYKTQTRNVILITGKYATRTKVLKSLKDQFSRAKEQDMIVFSFSGHGYSGGLCPYDMSVNENSGISYREIRSIFKQSRAKRKMVFADACYSGGIRGNASGSDNEHQDSEVLLFLSSRSGETSIESPFMVNGFFTTYLLRGLRGGADTDKNRKITAKELFHFVSQGVKERSKNKQHPVMWGKFDDSYVLMDWN